MRGRRDQVRVLGRWVCLLLAVGLAWQVAWAQAPRAGAAETATAPGAEGRAAQVAFPGGLPPVREVAERVRPAVVQIVARLATRTIDLFTGTVIPDTGIGSGVLFDSAGYILTNQHVVAGAQALLVALPDGRTFEGRLVGADPETDIAVVKIDGPNLPQAPLGDSSQLRVGDWVVAIGNALGLPGGPTVTVGVVSALGRTVTEPPDATGLPGPLLFDLIQTDAAINPGNSGGPLVNLNAEVVGINTLIASADEQGNPVQGIGFAIAINTVKPIAQELIATGRVLRGWLGIAYTWAGLVDALQLAGAPTPGVVVLRVQPGSPAALAGLQRGDLITQVNGQPLQDESSFPKQLQARRPGDVLQLTVVRNRTPRSIQVTLAPRPAL
jgi:S1-C subfamily serine protease